MPKNLNLNVRHLALILFLFAAVFVSAAAETNYFCIVCGKGPLTGRVWICKWGAVCGDCYRLKNHCSLCGLPVRTGDGRFICKFDRPTAVLDVAEAREIFTDVRRELVNLFDVDYWSEKGRSDGLHKFGFSSTRHSAGGVCTHEVVLLSGLLRGGLATAAHEYTHLWINENSARLLGADVVEAICELSAFKLMAAHGLPAQQQKILGNPYTHGEIKKIVALEKERGMTHVLNWVKNGTTENFETAAFAAPSPKRLLAATHVPPPLPEALKLGDLLLDGQSRQTIISGVSFAAGETRPVKLQDRTVQVRCREIRRAEVVLAVEGLAGAFTLKIGEEKFMP